MSVSNLTGTTWVFNSGILNSGEGYGFSEPIEINFISNNTSYTSIAYGYDYGIFISYDNWENCVYIYDLEDPESSPFWVNQAYRTITFTSDTSSSDRELLIHLLETCATQQVTSYTVTFNNQGYGTTPASQTIQSGGLVTQPTNPTATGKTFAGWYKESACTNAWNFSTDTVTANTTLYAKWDTATYTVTFDNQGKGTAPANQTISYNGTVTQPTALSAVGYTFGGWYKESACSNAWDFSTDVITEDKTLYAKWTANTYTISYLDEGGAQFSGTHSAIYPTQHIYGTSTALDTPTKTNYEFIGYYNNSACSGNILSTLGATDYTANITLYAKWSVYTYTVTFDVQGTGTAPASQNIVAGGVATQPTAPTAQGYRFDGWYNEASCSTAFDFTTPIVANKTLYAKWSQVTTYAVTFDVANKGTAPATQYLEAGSLVTQPTNPTSAGYNFIGWYKESSYTTAWNFSTDTISGATTLYGKWEQIITYSVTFDNRGKGTAPATQVVNSGSLVTQPTALSEDGYDFTGWYKESTCVNKWNFTTDTVTSNTILYAGWQKQYVAPTLNWNGNRFSEDYIFKRVGWDNWQEHDEYSYITSGSIEQSTSSDLKITGSFNFEGYEIPDVNDLVRVYYTFTDENNITAYEPLGTFFVSYASVDYIDTLKGTKAEGSLEASSVLSVLEDKLIGMPKTIVKSSNAVYEAQQLIQECGLQVEASPSSYSMSEYHTFDAGTSYLEMVNWLLDTASFSPAYPDAYGVVQLQSVIESQQRTDYTVFQNNDESIMYPEVEASNDWQNTPNIVRLIYNTDEACIVAEARNNSGSRASLSNRGNREITYFEELSELTANGGSRATALKILAEDKLIEKSCDIEYVTISIAYIPLLVYQPIRVIYSDMEWKGNVDVVSIDLSPATKTQLKVKRTLTEDISITSSATIYREDDD